MTRYWTCIEQHLYGLLSRSLPGCECEVRKCRVGETKLEATPLRVVFHSHISREDITELCKLFVCIIVWYQSAIHVFHFVIHCVLCVVLLLLLQQVCGCRYVRDAQ